MIDAAFCIPGELSLPTGGYRYDRELLARLPAHGVAVRHVALPQGFPHPSDEEIATSHDALRQAPGTGPLLIDGLALGALPPECLDDLSRPVVALVHHPLCLETGLSAERAAFLRRNEAEILQRCQSILVTSGATRRWLVDEFGLAAGAIAVAEPGIVRPARAIGKGAPPAILAVGAVSDRKAYPLLVEALASLKSLDWRLTIAGSTTLSPQATKQLEAAVAASGCAERIRVAGAVGEEELASLYAGADLFVSASLHEGYGMALAEALAYGLPIVASSAGAAGDLLPPEAALKVREGDASALAVALHRILTDHALRRALSDGAWRAGQLLPSWDDAARITAGVLRTAAARTPS